MSNVAQNNLTDRLGELMDKVTPGPVDVYPQPIGSADDAKAELAFQVDTTEDRQPFLFLLNAGGKCPATTGCGPTSQANAEFIALCFTHKDEILSALRKAEQPAATNAGVEHITGTLVGDLRACATSGSLYAAAADEIERQAADLRTYAKTMDMIGQITPSGDYAELVERLRKADFWYAYTSALGTTADTAPQEAATAIERLTAREAELRTLVALATGLVPGGYGNWHTRARLSLGDEK